MGVLNQKKYFGFKYCQITLYQRVAKIRKGGQHYSVLRYSRNEREYLGLVQNNYLIYNFSLVHRA
jgi:hypothetical protein